MGFRRPGQFSTEWSHFYKNDVNKITRPADGEIEEKLKSTDKLYDWFLKKE